MTGIDREALRTFVVVCELGNLTAAAKTLRMTQAAVSQRMRKLETHTRLKLLDRDMRPVQPTPLGRLVYNRARAILADLDRLEVEVHELQRLPLPELHFGISDSLGAALLPTLVSSIGRLATQLAVRVDSSANVCRALLIRELHAVISSDPLPERDHLERYELFREPLLLVLPATLRPPVRSELAALKWLARNNPFIRYSPVSPLARQIETYLGRHGISPPTRIELNASESILELVRAGLGWTITTPLCLIQARIDFSDLAISRLPLGNARRSVWLLARRNELGSLPRRLADLSCRIIEDRVVQRIERELPWLLPLVSVRPGETSWRVADKQEFG